MKDFRVLYKTGDTTGSRKVRANSKEEAMARESARLMSAGKTWFGMWAHAEVV